MNEHPWKILNQRVKEEPYHVVPGVLSLLNGYWHKLKFFLSGKRVKIGKCFRVYGKFRVIGPGQVEIGDHCLFECSILGPAVFYTEFPDAVIRLGDHVTLNGLVMQCYQNIAIGDYCSLADAFITDSQNHHLSADRRFLSNRTIPKAPVVLSRNIWVCSKVVILPGVLIGENSVIGACSLVRSDVAANSFYSGNPARFIQKIPPSNHEKFKPAKS